VPLLYFKKNKSAYIQDESDVGILKHYYQQSYEYFFRKLKFDHQCLRLSNFSTQYMQEIDTQMPSVNLKHAALTNMVQNVTQAKEEHRYI